MINIESKPGEPFCLDRSVVNITARCPLKCKLCVMGCPYYEEPPHYSLETIKETIDSFFQIVDHVRWYEFSGGETLIHKDLGAMIRKAMEYKDRMDNLLIFTNAAVWMSPDVENAILEYRSKILIMVSHYGDLSAYAARLKEWCDKNGVKCVVKIYYGDEQHCGGWLDYGDFTKLNRSEEELEEVFRKCGSTKMNGTFTTHGGEMHWCVPSARGMRLLGKIPRVYEDYIDLFDKNLTVEEQREKIKTLSKCRHITACDYCLGDFGDERTKRYPAAEQLGKPGMK
jgi:hypothetical protein